MTEVSKRVANCEAAARTVTSSAELHGPEVAAQLAQLLFPDGAPEPLTMAGLIQALGQSLERSTKALHEADIALANEIADDEKYRDDRDAATLTVRQDLIDASDLVRSTYGAEHLVTYGLQGETPRASDLLHNHGVNVERLLRQTPMPATPKPGRPAIDAAALADALRAHLDELKGTLGDVERESREYQTALTARDAELVDQQRIYQGVTEVLTGLFTLASRADLAARVRPSTRRRTGAAPVEEPPVPVEEPPVPVE